MSRVIFGKQLPITCVIFSVVHNRGPASTAFTFLFWFLFSFCHNLSKNTSEKLSKNPDFFEKPCLCLANYV